MKISLNKIKQIRTNFLILYGIITALFVFFIAVTSCSIEKIISYTESESTSEQLANHILNMRKYEKVFILNEIIDESFYENGKRILQRKKWIGKDVKLDIESKLLKVK